MELSDQGSLLDCLSEFHVVGYRYRLPDGCIVDEQAEKAGVFGLTESDLSSVALFREVS